MEKFKKPMFIACGGFIILIVFLFIMSSCKKESYTSEEFSSYLLEEAKEYYSQRKSALPQVDGGKTSLNIATLVEKQEDYIGEDLICSGSIDVVNNNTYYMYIPNINCTDGYSSKKLSDHLTSQENIVSSGNGLYALYDYYIYKGDSVDNFVIFNDQLWRVVRINADGSLKIIESDYIIKEKNDEIEIKVSRRTSEVWDDRYNEEKNYSSGFNDFIHNGINSRMKDYLDSVYKNYSEDVKGYIIKHDLCIGKRSVSDTINDGSIECSDILSDQYVGLLQLNEYINASLDSNCLSAESVTCSNYNYLSTFKSTYWSITAVKDNSYDIFKIGKKITDATANSTSTPKVVIHLSSEVRFTEGEGTLENPYVIS